MVNGAPTWPSAQVSVTFDKASMRLMVFLPKYFAPLNSTVGLPAVAYTEEMPPAALLAKVQL